MEEPQATPIVPEEKTEKLVEIVESVSQNATNLNALTRAELVAKLRELVEVKPISEVREQVEMLKQSFYRKLKAELEERAAAEQTETPEADPLEVEFKELMAKFREKKAIENAERDAEREANLVAKEQILSELEKLTNSADDLSEVIPAFRKLQQDWKNIGQVPAPRVADIWKTYSSFQEKFYDLIKINNDLREYDFKKNLEAKTALCEQAERLSEAENVVEAFKQLQKLHDDWREIGPVARELRESIWTRFKEASTVVNKRHQAYFESIKEQEEQLVAAKIELCERVEKIDYEALKTFKNWEDKTSEVVDIQAQWKAIGGVPSFKAASKALKRFRAACDTFFNNKKAFYKVVKDENAKNLAAKKALVAQAEALKTSTDWKATADKMVDLQRQWKAIGNIGNKKASDAVWAQFIAACDYFFEQKAANFSDKYSEEIANLKAKRAIIEKIETFERTENAANDTAALRELVAEFNKIGFVPFREKEKVAKAFKNATDKVVDLLRGKRSEKPTTERAKLVREYDRLKSELTTFENNIGFFANTKKENPLLAQMNKRIEALKKQYNEVVAQLKALDED